MLGWLVSGWWVVGGGGGCSMLLPPAWPGRLRKAPAEVVLSPVPVLSLAGASSWERSPRPSTNHCQCSELQTVTDNTSPSQTWGNNWTPDLSKKTSREKLHFNIGGYEYIQFFLPRDFPPVISSVMLNFYFSSKLLFIFEQNSHIQLNVCLSSLNKQDVDNKRDLTSFLLSRLH